AYIARYDIGHKSALLFPCRQRVKPRSALGRSYNDLKSLALILPQPCENASPPLGCGGSARFVRVTQRWLILAMTWHLRPSRTTGRLRRRAQNDRSGVSAR